MSSETRSLASETRASLSDSDITMHGRLVTALVGPRLGCQHFHLVRPGELFLGPRGVLVMMVHQLVVMLVDGKLQIVCLLLAGLQQAFLPLLPASNEHPLGRRLQIGRVKVFAVARVILSQLGGHLFAINYKLLFLVVVGETPYGNEIILLTVTSGLAPDKSWLLSHRAQRGARPESIGAPIA